MVVFPTAHITRDAACKSIASGRLFHRIRYAAFSSVAGAKRRHLSFWSTCLFISLPSFFSFLYPKPSISFSLIPLPANTMRHLSNSADLGAVGPCSEARTQTSWLLARLSRLSASLSEVEREDG